MSGSPEDGPTREASLLGRKVGNVRLIEVLGVGGMGTVYLGRDENLGRRVAVKALRDRELRRDVQRRLRREARLLSRLNHPNICQIYDALETEDGPFLVLELVEGRRLDELVAEKRSVGAAIELALPIFDALAAAHRAGVVHRDLKPSNVMVSREGVVKVLDFGLARGEDGIEPDEPEPSADVEDLGEPADLPTAPEHTATGALMGTFGYMSPEQARGEAVTVASDVYSLGLLLQELLTGTPAREMRPFGYLELVRRGRARISPRNLGAAWSRLLDEMTALEPEDRLSVFEARERLLRIRDRPRRLRRRILAAILGLAFLGGGVKYTVDLREALGEAERERRVAEQRASEAREASDFLVGMFDAAHPRSAGGLKLDVSELVERGIESLERRPLDPEVRDRLSVVIVQLLASIGDYERVLQVEQRRLALLEERGAGREAILSCRIVLAVTLAELGRRGEAAAMLDAVIAEARRSGARRVLAEALVHSGFGPPGENLERIEEGLDLLGRLDLEEPDRTRWTETGRSGQLAMLRVLGRSDECAALASRWLRDPSRTGRNRFRTGFAQASCLTAGGRLPEAEAAWRGLLEELETVGGSRLEDYRRALGNLAVNLWRQGRLLEAEPLYLRLLEVDRDHQNLNNLAVLYEELGRLEASEALHLEAMAKRRAGLGEETWQFEESVNNLGEVYRRQGRWDESVALQERCLEISRQVFGDGHPDAGWCWTALGNTRRDRGQPELAEEAYRRALAVREPAQAAGHPELSETRAELAELYRRTGRDDEARALLELEGVREQWEKEHAPGTIGDLGG